ncbi:hypothetical protein J8F10_35435 [Gemmata sp. G18]|uniref:Lipoprotein n=1 Tax=Gemmata palustris TaxID=2822762 RepID=A0ABS5C3H7_9BACT|nr:hypothetical protein [Gemmata palustris]MBP3960548.1 hypothetical protein [Gemmata palustris]
MKRFIACTVIALAGCGTPPASPPAVPPKEEHGEHTHERDKLLIADAGPYHALLTAHLSKTGHELDVFFETADAAASPVAIPIGSFTAEVQIRAGEGGVKKVEFKPAPLNERPAGEGSDRCSHFVAAVPWIDPDVPLRVTFEFTVDGKKVSARWNDFVPRKYAHHQD